MSGGGQPPVGQVAFRNDLHLPHTLNLLSSEQSQPIDPQQLAQGIGVAAVGLLLGLLLRLNQHDLTAAVFRQQPQQPIVEAADFDDRHVASFRQAALPHIFQELIKTNNLKGHGIYYYVPRLLQHFQTHAHAPFIRFRGDWCESELSSVNLSIQFGWDYGLAAGTSSTTR
ncbi:MAG: hypothetical protein HC779_04260 [Phyllobacteriaceae bacterium]|nr:hypothetical protein [Phyllobacteriaceae bacterium]